MDYSLALRNFLNDEGLLRQMPARHRLRAHVYLWAAQGLEEGRRYTESEINGHIQRILAFRDPVTIRRALVDYGFLDRTPDGAAYWLREVQPTLQDIVPQPRPPLTCGDDGK